MKNRYWVIIVIAILVVIPAWSQKAGQTIRASAFILEDDQGRNRAKMWMAPEGPRLDLYDENGIIRFEIVVSEIRTELTMNDKNGDCRVQLESNKDLISLIMVDTNGIPRLMLVVDEYRSGLAMFDKNLETVWKVEYPIEWKKLE